MPRRTTRAPRSASPQAKAKYDSGDGGALSRTSKFVQRFCARMVNWGLFGIDVGKPGSEDYEVDRPSMHTSIHTSIHALIHVQLD